MKKYLFIFLGSLSLFLGCLGLITPGLPTTPFVLLTGYFYARSSPPLYAKLQQNKFTGVILKGAKEGFSLKVRIFSISLMWTMVLISAFFVFKTDSIMRPIMLGLGVIGTIAQLLAVKKKKIVRE